MSDTLILLFLVCVSYFFLSSCGVRGKADLPVFKLGDAENLLGKYSKDGPLILDRRLTKAHFYFESLLTCQTEVKRPEKENCYEKVKGKNPDFWGNTNLPQNKFVDYYLTDPFIGKYNASDFEWSISLHGRVDGFVLGGRNVFPPVFNDALLSLYLDHHEQNNGIVRVGLNSSGVQHYSIGTLTALREGYKEFNLKKYMSGKELHPSIVSGYEFKMMMGSSFLDQGKWRTNYSQMGCRVNESFFYKVQFEYGSDWLAELFNSRDVAYLHMCADELSLRRVTVFKLDYSNR